jgi:hypothetical protein
VTLAFRSSLAMLNGYMGVDHVPAIVYVLLIAFGVLVIAGQKMSGEGNRYTAYRYSMERIWAWLRRPWS